MSEQKKKTYKKVFNKELSNKFSELDKILKTSNETFDIYFEYQTLYFTLPDWIKQNKINIEQIFKNTLLDIVNSHFIDNNIPMRMFLVDKEITKYDTYTLYTFTYMIQPDVKSKSRIGFKLNLFIQYGLYPKYNKSFAVTLVLHSLIDITTGKEYKINYLDFEQINKEICKNDTQKCERLFKTIKNYAQLVMDSIVVLLGINEYTVYNY